MLTLQTSTAADEATIALVGDVDMSTGPALAEELARAIDAGATRIVLECSRLDYLDSTGLRVLTEAPDHVAVRLTNAPDRIRKLFRIVEMTDYLGD